MENRLFDIEPYKVSKQYDFTAEEATEMRERAAVEQAQQRAEVINLADQLMDAGQEAEAIQLLDDYEAWLPDDAAS